jgi:hypothetical protein
MNNSMEAEACACNFDDDPADIWHEATRRARKSYRCCECGETIPIGALYVCVSGLDDSQWFRSRTCKTCWNIRRDYGQCSPLGYLREDVWELLGVDYVSGRVDD